MRTAMAAYREKIFTAGMFVRPPKTPIFLSPLSHRHLYTGYNRQCLPTLVIMTKILGIILFETLK